jgi:hypothetical protein
MKTIACTLLFTAVAAAASAPKSTTFNKDVAPILYNRCAECHRAGQVAPMSLLTYGEARPWAKSIREAVLKHSMPPWLADPRYGHFENDRRLSQTEINTIVAWVDGGVVEGNAADLPPLPHFEEGWTIGKPDVVIALDNEVDVPAEGVIPYKYARVHSKFTEDKWVQAAEIRPGNRAVVHHIIVSIAEPGTSASESGETARAGRAEKLCGFAPGEQPKAYPPGTAKFVKAGSDLIFQLHYTPNGKATKDRSYIGLIFAKQPAEKRALTGTATNATFRIPPGDPNYEVHSSFMAKDDIRIVDLMPHMHLRGKDFKYTAVYPDGRTEVLLEVPKYDFNWQLLYRFKEPVLLPKGSRLDCVAHFDNSPNNKYNPDPAKEVRWGPQTWEEMMIGWFDYTIESQTIRASK